MRRVTELDTISIDEVRSLAATLDDPKHRASIARLREIARAREVVVDFFAGENEYGSTGVSLQKYFDQFAIAARRAHRAG